jgi:hypothetical protein
MPEDTSSEEDVPDLDDFSGYSNEATEVLIEAAEDDRLTTEHQELLYSLNHLLLNGDEQAGAALRGHVELLFAAYDPDPDASDA